MVHAPECKVPRRVLHEVHELETGADVVTGDKVGLVRAPVNAQDKPPDRFRRKPAVVPNLLPALVAILTLIDAVRFDEPLERLVRKIAGFDCCLQTGHNRCPWRAGKLLLELVEERRAIAGRLVTQVVHEAGEAVDRPEVRPCSAWRQQGGDREIVRARASMRSAASSGVSSRPTPTMR